MAVTMPRAEKDEAAQAALAKKRLHPDGQLAEMLGGYGKPWAEFNGKPLDPDYWAMWAGYFDNLFREAPSSNQRTAIEVELRGRGFTNLHLRDAANFIIKTRRQWPFVSDFLDEKNDKLPPSLRE
jgi:hypothetical protein